MTSVQPRVPFIVEDAWIPLPDGVKLRARVWRPEDGRPVPGILEYLPYRLDDWTAPRDSERHPYYASHGYASVRVDIRGTGSSDGHFDDEYSAQEQADGLVVIEWIAKQAWCSGSLGMIGISWGGFNSLQLASHAPEALKAIVTVCSTDDRYDNDVHYLGGALLGIDMAAWGATMLAFNARPPRPEVVGAGWRDQWRDRLEAMTPMTPIWLSHQERDDYWRHGSVCENYSSITAAVLAVGGWHDPYRDTVLRLVANLSAPVKGIIGPWSHQYPDRDFAPGPAIGFLQETVRWWDHWLKGEETGVMAEPALRAFLSDSERPATFYPERRGRWIGTDWPSPSAGAVNLTWDAGSCSVPVDAAQIATVRSPQQTGLEAGRFFPFGNATDLPPDQRAEDGRATSITFAPLTETLDLLGNATLRVRLSSDQPQATLIARLCDVAPDGSSTLVTRGVLNLNKRLGRDRAVAMPIDEFTEVTFDLVSVGYSVPAGHSLRIALSSNYWPWIWPQAVEATLRVDLAASILSLPVFTPDEQAAEISFLPPEQSPRMHIEPVENSADGVDERFIAPAQRSIAHNVETGEWTLDVDPGYGGSRRYPDGLVFTEHSRETYRITEGEPESASASSAWAISLANDGWRARLETQSRLSATATHFVIENSVIAFATQGDAEEECVAERTWYDEVPRTSA